MQNPTPLLLAKPQRVSLILSLFLLSFSQEGSKFLPNMGSRTTAGGGKACFPAHTIVKFRKSQLYEPPSIALVIEDDNMLLEILARVPVKALFAFKCVSKRWCCLISQPSFARTYVRRRIESPKEYPPAWTLLYQFTYGRGFSDIPPDPESLRRLCSGAHKSPGLSVLVPPLHVSHNRVLTILASSNGLLLSRLDGYFVCNPITQQWVALPLPPHRLKYVIEGFVTQAEDGIVAAYKVVRMERLCENTRVLNIEIFASETGEWKSYRAFTPNSVQLLDYRPVLYNGLLHWYDIGYRMVGYDPNGSSDRCRLINLPRTEESILLNEKYSGITRFCQVSGESLRYFEVIQGVEKPSLRVWGLRNYETGEWSMEYRIICGEILSADAYVSSLPGVALPLACDPFDVDVVYLWCGRGLVCCDVGNRKFEIIRHPVFSKMMLFWSLVYPYMLVWPTPVPLPAGRAP
ncbi:F-box protein At1g49990-like [Malania oleifera]|uniref:F-box protein At1g49990-like n=1 Tax=Malania oleifera TaxID=397392 RepID=UPI0025AE3D71|nr:F-box protein At1g49990-like [Malania oleifera]